VAAVDEWPVAPAGERVMMGRMLAAAADGSFTVAPDLGLILFPLYVWAVVIAAVVTALKGQWRWLLVGIVLLGPLLFYAAFLPAEPDSVLGRRKTRRSLAT
jgi:hypothetical protein